LESAFSLWVELVEALFFLLTAASAKYGTSNRLSANGCDLMNDLDQMREHLLAAIAASGGLDALDTVRVGALGKQGNITALLKTLGGMSPEQRLTEGPRIQGLREAVTAAIAEKKAALDRADLDARLARETLDMTLPVDGVGMGSVHPVSQVMDELAEIFADLGFAVATGPEIEDDWHNFTALNIPESHPARAMHDTFYFPEGAEGERKMLLRTHTSPVQIRTMLNQKPPIRIIAPGRTYRSDSDATHTPMFHQVEGLVIDKGITLGHLKWTLETFLKAFFERDDVVLRLRPSYFPFTEPSAEVDVGYTLVNGKRVIGGSDGWMEVLGSGMVHPKVIAACGLDPEEWQGFAFGCGIDRLAMLKYGMDDLRAFFDGDIRWLKHYGFAALDVPTLSGGVGA
jgi:phenylalanyl-tRNA synthetase alpha chain